MICYNVKYTFIFNMFTIRCDILKYQKYMHIN